MHLAQADYSSLFDDRMPIQRIYCRFPVHLPALPVLSNDARSFPFHAQIHLYFKFVSDVYMYIVTPCISIIKPTKSGGSDS